MRTFCSRRGDKCFVCAFQTCAQYGRRVLIRQGVGCGPTNPSDGYVTTPVHCARKLHVTCLPPANMPALYRAVQSRTSLPAAAALHGEHDVLNLPHIRHTVTFFQLLVALDQSATITTDDVLRYSRVEPRPLCSPTWRAGLVLSILPHPLCGSRGPRPGERGLGV